MLMQGVEMYTLGKEVSLQSFLEGQCLHPDGSIMQLAMVTEQRCSWSISNWETLAEKRQVMLAIKYVTSFLQILTKPKP